MATIGEVNRLQVNRTDHPQLDHPSRLELAVIRACGTLSRVGGYFYDRLPTEFRKPLFTALKQVLQVSLFIVPTLQFMGAVKITYIALSMFAILALGFTVYLTLKRGSSVQANNRLVGVSGDGDLCRVRFFLGAGARGDIEIKEQRSC